MAVICVTVLFRNGPFGLSDGLQWFTGYLGLAVVFLRGGAVRGGRGGGFRGFFADISNGFGHFPDIS